MERVRLTEICNPKQWRTIPTSDLLEEGYPVYGANGIIGYYNEYNHEQPVVAITCRGATCGKINITVPKAYITGNAMCLDDVRSDIELTYLYYCLMNYDFDTVISGSAQPQITRQGLEKVEIRIGTPEEQRRIVCILNKANAIIANRKQQLQALDDLVKARFVEMFGNLCNSKYTTSMLGNICKFRQGTQIPVEEQKNEPVGSNCKRFLRIIDYTQAPQPPRYVNVEGTEVEDDSVVIVRYGASAGFVGRGYKGILANNLFEIMPDERIMSKDFLYLVLKYGSFEKVVHEKAFGAAMPALSFSMMNDISVVVPPSSEQNQFVLFVEQIDRVKNSIQQSLSKTQELFDSLMQEYFG